MQKYIDYLNPPNLFNKNLSKNNKLTFINANCSLHLSFRHLLVCYAIASMSLPWLEMFPMSKSSKMTFSFSTLRNTNRCMLQKKSRKNSSKPSIPNNFF